MQFLEIAASAFIEGIVGSLTDNLLTKINSDAARDAYREALGSAILRYAALGTRLTLTYPLTQDDGPLTKKAVATEIAKLTLFEQVPDTKLIGDYWKSALENPPQWRDFTDEANRLLGFLESELRDSDTFRPVFEALDINAIAAHSAVSAASLANIESQVINLIELVNSSLGNIDKQFNEALPNIRDNIRDYTRYIQEKTRSFVGREIVFDAIERFINNEVRGYIFIHGDPGIGKTALAAQLVKVSGYIHHFNIRAEGINKTSDFLNNVCSQLIAVYELGYKSIPPSRTHNTGFLNKLLDDVSEKLDGTKCVIVIDALDEASNVGVSSDANPLYLPQTLPEGIFFICTMRRRESVSLRIDIPEQRELPIKQEDDGNIADIRRFVATQTPKVGIQVYIERQEIDGELFIDHIVEKSQGNFMYLRMVLPEIENGAYKDLDLSNIPIGLKNYYRDHWRRMRHQNDFDWFDWKLPIILALTVVKKPISIDLISDFVGIRDKRRIRAVLNDFDQFLYRITVDDRGGKKLRYRWYHDSFFDFVASLEIIAEERVNLVNANKKIADKLWNDLFDE